MKQFFSNVLSTVVGIFIAGAIFCFFFFAGITVIALSSASSSPIKENSVLAINLTGLMQERANEAGLPEQLLGVIGTEMGLDRFRKGVERAKNNPDIKGIYLEMGAFAADSYATLQEARQALLDFKKSGKWVIAYGDSYTQGSYYLASAANKVYLNPQGMIDWHGLASQPYFVKDVLAKFGVKIQIAKVGKYKSATEMFTESRMSDANREQTQAYLNAIWSNVTKEVGASRGLSVAQLNEYADSAVTLSDPKEYRQKKLVDGLLYTDQVKGVIKKMLSIADEKEIPQATLADVIDATDGDEQLDGDEVAVYYAYGNIIDGAAGNPMTQDNVIDAQVVCKDLEALAKDDDVKAVVLRINSGGGSAYASEQIWHQVMELKKKKPVVVSMGGLAASGAYYSSAPANWIVADPNTLTGSIGIFGMFPDASGLLTEKLGVKFDEVKTNKHSAFGTMARPFNADEMHLLEQYVNRGYALFCHRVAEGRRMTEEQVEKIAQGHVFAGQDAIKIGLIDQLGNLKDAIAKAAQLAKIKDYYTQDYPSPTPWLERILGTDYVDNYLDQKAKNEMGALYEPYSLLRNINSSSAIQARLPYEPNIH